MTRAKVIQGWQIAHGSKLYTGGQVFDAPEADVDRWVVAGWAAKVKAEKAKAESKAKDSPKSGKSTK